MNRVEDAFRKTKVLLNERLTLGQTTTEKLEALSRSLDLDVTEFCHLQELKSIAQMHGRISLDEANTIYNAMGNSIDTFNTQPVHIKIVLTKIFAELIKEKA